MDLKDTPEWKKYLERCKEKGWNPGLTRQVEDNIGFVRWIAQRENGMKKRDTTPVNDNMTKITPSRG